MSYVSNLESNPNLTTESTPAAATTKPKLPVTLSTLNKLKANGETFSCLTCYDASFAAAMQVAGIDTILIGDSLGMVVQGQTSTLPVTIADMVYHTQNVARANSHALILCDLPFMSVATLERALDASQAVMQAGAHVVKIEGGAELAKIVSVLANNGVPTCVHLGLTPQSVNVFGGYKVQGKTDTQAENSCPHVKPGLYEPIFPNRDISDPHIPAFFTLITTSSSFSINGISVSSYRTSCLPYRFRAFINTASCSSFQ